MKQLLALLREIRTPLLAPLLVALALGGGYFFYVQNRERHLTDLHFRQLAAMARDIESAAAFYRQVLRHTGEEGPARDVRPEELEPLEAGESGEATAGGLRFDGGQWWVYLEGGGNRGRVRLAAIFEAVPPPEAFERWALARGDGGEVVLGEGPSVPRLASLAGLMVNDDQGKPEPLDPDGLAATSSLAEVSLAGQAYRLYLVPLEPRTFGAGNGGPDGDTERAAPTWVLAGLLPADAFRAQSLAFSATLSIVIVVALLLAFFSLPFLKILVMTPAERLRKVDAVMAVVCGLMGLSVLTLLLLDLAAYHHLRRLREADLETWARRLEQRFEAQLEDALARLEAFGRASAGQPLCRDADVAPSRFTAQAAAGFGAAGGPFRGDVGGREGELFFRVDAAGRQCVKWSAGARPTPPIDVGERHYFRAAAAGEVAFEAVRSWTSGQAATVLAMPAAGEPPGVVALATTFLAAERPLRPPGYGFAVFDEDGRVLLHSNPARESQENFLTETERNERLRAALHARQPAILDVLYRGAKHRVALRPLGHRPLALAAFQDKEPLQTMNLQVFTTAVIFLVLYEGTILVLAALLMLASPRRSLWLWPDPEQVPRYRRLTAAYLCFAVIFLLLTFQLDWPGMLQLSLLLPLLVLLMTYPALNPWHLKGDRGDRRRVVTAVTRVGLFLFTLFLLAQALEEVRGQQGPGRALAELAPVLVALALVWVVREVRLRWQLTALLMVGALALGLAFTWVVCRGDCLRTLCGAGLAILTLSLSAPSWRPAKAASSHPAERPYRAMALCLLGLLGVLPALGLFRAAYDLEVLAFANHLQVEHARSLARRAARDGGSGDLSRSLELFRSTRLYLEKTAARGDLCCAEGSEGRQAAGEPWPCPAGRPPYAWMRQQISRRLPLFNDTSVTLREHLLPPPPTAEWTWCRREQGLRLHYRLEHTAPRGTGVEKPGEDDSGALLHMETTLPTLARAFLLGPRPVDGNVPLEIFPKILALLYGLALLFALLWFLVRFLERHIFLTRARLPRWLERLFPLDDASLAGNLLLLGTTPEEREALRQRPDVAFFDLSDLSTDQDEPGIGVSVSGETRVVALAGLEMGLEREEVAAARRALLEELLDRRGRVVLALCASDPRPRLLAAGGATAEGQEPPERSWTRVLERFTVVEPRQPRPGGAPSGGEVEHPVDLLLGRECAPRRELAALAEDLRRDPEYRALDREGLLAEIGSRAAEIYRALWNGCLPREKVVLHHLAEEGLVNPRGSRVLLDLMARGLVARDPAPRLMNQTFRRFVRSAFCRRQVRALKRGAPSRWLALRRPLFLLLLVLVAAFYGTQQKVLDNTAAILTSLAGLMPLVLQLLGLFGSGRRGDGGAAET